jgi:membrane protease YdiL (CAAX protease family)
MIQNDSGSILVTDKHENETNNAVTYPNINSVITLFFVSILYMVAVAIPIGIALINIPNDARLLKSFLNLAMYVISFLLIINYTVKKSRKQQGYIFHISFNKIQGWVIPAIIIAALSLIIPLSKISEWIPMPESVRKLFEQTFTKDIFSIFTVAIAAPILEEILCRGIVLKGLLNNYSPFKAILISAIFFSLLHLNPWQAMPAFFSGLFIGWVYYKTQSVMPGIIIHTTINATATLLLFLPGKAQDLWGFLGAPYFLIAFMGSLFVFAAVCLFIQKKTLVISKSII